MDNSAGYGAVITAKVTPGSTLTTGCTVTVNVSPDGTTWYFYAAQTSGLVSGTNYAMSFEVTLPVIKAQVVFSGHSASCTVEAQYQMATGL